MTRPNTVAPRHQRRIDRFGFRLLHIPMKEYNREVPMTSKMERSIAELYGDDPERADAVVFQRGTSRRGFLGGAAFAGVSAAVGGAIPFAEHMPDGFVPAAFAQAQPSGAGPAQPKGPQYLSFPGKNDKLVVLGDRPLVAETPEH